MRGAVGGPMHNRHTWKGGVQKALTVKGDEKDGQRASDSLVRIVYAVCVVRLYELC